MKNIILLLLCLTVLTSCSVVMAARKDGVSVEKVQAAHTRGQILATGPTVISGEYLPSGQFVEVYQFQKERGSAARAFMHGLLDVSTCGLWEVVGTPIEAVVDQKEYYTIRITYDDNDFIQIVELM